MFRDGLWKAVKFLLYSTRTLQDRSTRKIYVTYYASDETGKLFEKDVSKILIFVHR